ncbi:MAG: adenylyl-sulfate kinase [Acidimicrobiaceae bacterium]|nr:adenylyl-sulfate kinase [Acidimicrobiaceae bacterium]MYG99771.1 adenylyl-sulfate kinase [Acidimicrobiaceae bacterium]MYL05163.1 adenylyl-sulfate kinase [Acidimicrobiaceae bacterium]
MTGEESSPSGESAVVWSAPTVTAGDRAGLLGHGAVTVWLTGLPGSGKSTLAHAAAAMLAAENVLAYVLDGDNLRFGLNSDLGFSPDDRAENIRRAGEVAALLRDAGVVVLASFISPYRGDRDRARSLHPDGAFVEVFVDAPLEVCERRDPKGLYAKARSGAIAGLTGISAPYEEPDDPELRIDTSADDVQTAAAVIVAEVLARVRRSSDRGDGNVG